MFFLVARVAGWLNNTRLVDGLTKWPLICCFAYVSDICRWPEPKRLLTMNKTYSALVEDVYCLSPPCQYKLAARRLNISDHIIIYHIYVLAMIKDVSSQNVQNNFTKASDCVSALSLHTITLCEKKLQFSKNP